MLVGRIAPDGQSLKQLGPVVGRPARNVQKIGGRRKSISHARAYGGFLLGGQVAEPLGFQICLCCFQQDMGGGQQVQNKRVGIIVHPAMNPVVEPVKPLNLDAPDMQRIVGHHSNPEIMAACASVMPASISCL